MLRGLRASTHKISIRGEFVVHIIVGDKVIYRESSILFQIECLFYVLTCIGQDMEQQLPQQLELLMGLVRDAFLNAGESAASIRRTLLQLIELKASHWQLPGNTVLYYTHTNN